MAKICSRCKQSFADTFPGELCLKCHQRDEDFKEFDLNSYTRDELSSIPVAQYIQFYVSRGFLASFLIMACMMVGVWIGLSVAGNVGSGVGGFAGIVSGSALVRLLVRQNHLQRYKVLTWRLNSVFIWGAFPSSVVGLIMGACLSKEMGLIPKERPLPCFLIAACLAGVTSVIGGLVAVLIRNKHCRETMLKHFDEWSAERGRQPPQCSERHDPRP